MAWQKMPMLPPEAAKAGVFPGGEGCQWPRGGVVLAQSEPNFLLLPIDVGGLYRSLDGGKNWESATIGWNARGANAFAIDPRNPNRVLGVGGNSMDWGENWGPNIPHGVYLSTDKAASWKQVHKFRDGLATTVAIDPSSYDSAKGYCTTAYAVASIGGFLKSTDGGETWAEVDTTTSELVRGLRLDGHTAVFLQIHPTTGYLYLGGKTGLYKSTDGGKTFAKLRGSEVWGLATLHNQPNHLYISGAEGLLHSADSGATFPALLAKGVDRNNNKPLRDVSVSPADPQRMTCWVQGDNWQWVRYISHDAGKTFTPITIQKGFAPMPQNVRQGYYTWHPTDKNLVYGLGGDWVTRSTDGGKSFTWYSNGYNGVMVGGLFNFSTHQPNTVFLAFQDYNGAFTTDGGKTWNYRDVSGKGWGGFCYGGHAVDSEVMWYGDAESWGGKRRLRVSLDGGATWKFAQDAETGKEAEWSGGDVSLSDPRNKNILFASNYRSADKGKTWRAMPDCQGVYTHTPDGRLLGKRDKTVVLSKDSGATWEAIAECPGGISDIAYDPVRQQLYVASENRLRVYSAGKWEDVSTPKNQYGGIHVSTVAVDPQNPAIVYIGGPANVFASHATVCRSRDAGKTWENLTVQQPLSATVKDGPHEVAAIRVHPKTREAWVNGQCYGMWRLPPPP